MSGWLKISGAAEYGGVSKDTFNTWPTQGLRFVRLPSGTRLFKEEWIDQFLESFEAITDDGNKVNQIIDQVMKEL